jgi:hypothetical protein
VTTFSFDENEKQRRHVLKKTPGRPWYWIVRGSRIDGLDASLDGDADVRIVRTEFGGKLIWDFHISKIKGSPIASPVKDKTESKTENKTEQSSVVAAVSSDESSDGSSDESSDD